MGDVFLFEYLVIVTCSGCCRLIVWTPLGQGNGAVGAVDEDADPLDAFMTVLQAPNVKQVIVRVVVVFTLKNRSDLYIESSLSYSRQRNEFPWSQADPK